MVPQTCKDSTVFKQQESLDDLSQRSTGECSPCKSNKRRNERVKGQVAGTALRENYIREN